MHLTPFDLPQAREAIKTAGALQRGAEQAMREEAGKLASRERAYRLLLANKITRLHTEGVAWTTCETIAKGDPEVAQARYDRDVQRGVLDATQQAAFRHGADRRDLHTILTWSMRRELAENGGPDDRLDLGVAA